MLYLEDYLESKHLHMLAANNPEKKELGHFIFFSVIEHLPSGLRDRFTEMREMDLSVQSEYFSVGFRSSVWTT